MQEEQWKIFEGECCKYLNDAFSNHYHCVFTPEGGSNSHVPDINVVKDKHLLFAIEAKSPQAQCGQFVLFPDESTKKFTYSPRNEFPNNEYSKRIIEAMEKDFDKYSSPSNATLDLDVSLFYAWIKNHYKEGRNTRFVISKGKNYVIFPVDKFEEYFDVEARYRIKKSGSSTPPKSRIDDIKAVLKASGKNYSGLRFTGKELNVALSKESSEKFVLTGKDYRYQFNETKSGVYNVRQLSNTRNANVIFSIYLKKDQDPEDLAAFKKALM